MKTAAVYVAGWYIACPYCQADMADEDGSQLIQASSALLRESVTCWQCGKVYRLPARVLRSK